MTSLKTLTKPQRDLLAAVDAGAVWQRGNHLDFVTGTAIYIRGDGQQTPVNGKTWKALAGAGLVEFGPRPARFRAPRSTTVTDKGKQVLAGETVNTARSLTFTFRLGAETVVRRVALPSQWHQYPDQHARWVEGIRDSLLAELVTVEWAESDAAAEDAS